GNLRADRAGYRARGGERTRQVVDDPDADRRLLRPRQPRAEARDRQTRGGLLEERASRRLHEIPPWWLCGRFVTGRSILRGLNGVNAGPVARMKTRAAGEIRDVSVADARSSCAASCVAPAAPARRVCWPGPPPPALRSCLVAPTNIPRRARPGRAAGCGPRRARPRPAATPPRRRAHARATDVRHCGRNRSSGTPPGAGFRRPPSRRGGASAPWRASRARVRASAPPPA